MTFCTKNYESRLAVDKDIAIIRRFIFLIHRVYNIIYIC